MQSNYQYAKTDQMVFFYDTEVYAGNVLATGAAATMSEQGVSRMFSSIRVSMGSTLLEEFKLDEVSGQFYSTIGRKAGKFLTLLEGFAAEDCLAATGKGTFGLRLMTSLLYSMVALPLPILAGFNIELVLADVSNTFLSNAATEVVIRNPYIRYLAISPDTSYTLALQKLIASGGSIFLPAIRHRTFLGNGLGSDIIDQTVSLGQYESIDSVSVTFWNAPAYRNRTNDKFSRYKYHGLKGWSITAADIVNPKERLFRCGPSDACLETLLVTLMSSAGSLNNIDDYAELRGETREEIFDNYLNKFFKFGLNYTSANEAHGSGVDLTNAATTQAVVHMEFDGVKDVDLQIAVSVTASVWIEINSYIPIVHTIRPNA
ncbi:MAG: hypothetical protein EOP09_13520 [Proteobacteria bacterium]|nr:MAG: hypothetical protein EOP09_13520 [Pseudomonadota bacterium]